jgi:hypothetical protein
MLKRRYLLRLTVALLILLSSGALLALPETQSQPMMRGPHGECWCGCDKAMGHARCMKLCELPKYEDRSWATSCHKTTITPQAAPSPAPAAAPAKPAFHTTRRYRYLYAQSHAAAQNGTPR